MKEAMLACRVVMLALFCQSVFCQDNAAVTQLSAKVYYDSSVLPKLSSQLLVSGACSPSNAANQNPTSARWKYSYKSPTHVNWIRPHVTVSTNDVSNWQLVIRDSSGNVVDGVVAGDLDGSGVWAEKVLGDSFVVELLSGQRVEAQFCVDKINVDSPQARVEVKALTGDKDRRIDLRTTNPFYSLRTPVAMVLFQDLDGSDTNCTAFALTAKVIVTNFHCLSTKSQLRNARALFAFEVDAPTFLERKLTGFAVPPNKGLDYSVLVLDAPVPQEFVSHVNPGFVTVGQALILMQHPEARRKMTVTEGCKVQDSDVTGTSIASSDFYHLCESSDGSSGSPVMNTSGAVVGVHHMAQYHGEANHFYNLALKISMVLKDLAGTTQGKAILADVKIDN